LESFGTLDPDTLALVSETLQGLRVCGRMIGIITHIPELRDEFAQQIIVTKREGFSTVESTDRQRRRDSLQGRDTSLFDES
jgi:exonuclease SbcC